MNLFSGHIIDMVDQVDAIITSLQLSKNKPVNRTQETPANSGYLQRMPSWNYAMNTINSCLLLWKASQFSEVFSKKRQTDYLAGNPFVSTIERKIHHRLYFVLFSGK